MVKAQINYFASITNQLKLKHTVHQSKQENSIKIQYEYPINLIEPTIIDTKLIYFPYRFRTIVDIVLNGKM